MIDITKHYNLIYKCVSSFRYYERDELISVGQLALVKAGQSYDPNRGVPFSSYACQYIRGAMLNEIRDYNRYHCVRDWEYGEIDKREPLEELLTVEHTTDIAEHMKHLTDKQHYVLKCLYGLDGEQPERIGHIAKRMGLSANSCTNHKKLGLRKLRKLIESRHL